MVAILKSIFEIDHINPTHFVSVVLSISCDWWDSSCFLIRHVICYQYLWLLTSYLYSLQTLDIVAENPDKFRIVALAAGSNIALLADQVI